MTRHPRPILVNGESPASGALPFSSCGNMGSLRVHFPPTPCLTSMRYTHSPNTYDRAPIAISPNVCGLPDRGTRRLRSPPAPVESESGRGRTRGRPSDYGQESDVDVKGSYFHPRAFEACQPEPLDVPSPIFYLPSPPALVADLSPCEEPDDPIVTPPDPELPAALAFPLPLHLPDKAASPFPYPERARVRIAAGSSVVPPSPPMVKTVQSRRAKPTLVRRSRQVDAFGLVADEGCLGGF